MPCLVSSKAEFPRFRDIHVFTIFTAFTAFTVLATFTYYRYSLYSRSGFVRKTVVLKRQRTHALSGRGEDGIAQRWNHRADRRFADPAPESAGGQQDGFDVRRLGQAQHPVIREIALYDAAVLDGDFFMHGRAQAPDHAALDLRDHGIRMHHVTAVERNDDTLYFDDRSIRHGNLDHRGGEAAVGIDDCNATVNAFRRRLVPGCGFHHRFHHPEILLAFQQRTAERDRVLAAGLHQFVDEAFAEERIMRMGDGAPEARRHVRI